MTRWSHRLRCFYHEPEPIFWGVSVLTKVADSLHLEIRAMMKGQSRSLKKSGRSFQVLQYFSDTHTLSLLNQ